MAIDQVIRIQRAQHERIAREAQRHRVSASQEIRSRLEMTLSVDDPTLALLGDVVRFVALQRRSGNGLWHENARAFAIFRAGLDAVIERHRPRNAPSVDDETTKALTTTLINLALAERETE